MKNILLLSFILIPIVLLAQKNFAPLNAEWKYEGHSYDCTGDHQLFRVENELMIEDKNCSIIYAYQWNDESNSWQASGDTLVVWENGSEVYFLEDTSFYLLFDFDLEMGDTMFYYNPINRGLFSSTVAEEEQQIPNMLACKVYDVEQVEAQSGQMLRKYYVETIYENASNCVHPYEIVENIGVLTNRFTGEPCAVITDGCLGGFVCYRSESISFYSDSFDCDTFTSTDDLTKGDRIKIFPNPTTNHWTLEWSYPDKARLQITDLQGRLLREQEVQPGQQEISAQGLLPGVYLLQIRSEAALGSVKVVKW